MSTGSIGVSRGVRRRTPASAAAIATSRDPTTWWRNSRLTGETVLMTDRDRRAMRIAIVSDIHGNRHAFEAVLDAIADSECEEIWCLGDLVGYGADPDACVDLARRHTSVCLAGNHDLGVTGGIKLEDFSRGAALAPRPQASPARTARPSASGWATG